MKPQFKTALVVLGIILGTIIGVSLLYNIFTSWEKRRCLINQHTVVIPAHRGDILDKNGKILATTLTVYDAYLDCSVIQDSLVWNEKVDSLAPMLANKFLIRDAAQWQDYLQEGRHKGKRYMSIARDLTEQDVAEIKTFPIFNLHIYRGGGIIQSRDKRCYPYGALARQTIGYIGTTDTSRFGLEHDYNDVLQGSNGKKTVLSGRYEAKTIKKVVDSIPAVNGLAIRTTIDCHKQTIADSILRETVSSNSDIEAGCVLLMNTKTGALEVAVNLCRDSVSDRILEKESVYNRMFEPGSVAKVLTLAAAIEEGRIKSLYDSIPTNHGFLSGMTRDFHIEEYERRYETQSISILDGFRISSNYVFGYLAKECFGDSASTFRDYLHKYCPSSDIEYPGIEDVSGKIIMSNAMGYGFRMTPLSILSLYNTIANKGKKMKPYFIEDMQDDNSRKEYGPVVMGQVMPEAVADTLTKVLRAVVTDGTGKVLKDTYPTIAGKTGTSKIASRKDVAGNPYIDLKGQSKWVGTFVGHFPADAPQYSIICVLFSDTTNHPFYGGSAPSRVVRDYVQSLYPDL